MRDALINYAAAFVGLAIIIAAGEYARRRNRRDKDGEE